MKKQYWRFIASLLSRLSFNHRGGNTIKYRRKRNKTLSRYFCNHRSKMHHTGVNNSCNHRYLSIFLIK